MLLLEQFEFFSSCLWRGWKSLNSFYNEVSIFLQGSHKEKQNPESWSDFGFLWWIKRP